MAVRHAVLGNSHIAALKFGWNMVHADEPDADFTFFSTPAKQMKTLEVGNGRISSEDEVAQEWFMRSSGHANHVALDEYDRFWIFGGGLNTHRLVQLYGRFRAESHNDAGTNQIALSDTAFAATVMAAFRKTDAVRFAQLIRSQTDAPIVVLPDPYVAHHVTEGDDGKGWEQLIAAGDAELLAKTFKRVLRRLLADAATPIFQGRFLCESALTTKSRFSAREGDVRHMNARFGAITLRHALRVYDKAAYNEAAE